MKIRNKLTYKFVFIVAGILLFFSLAIYYFTKHYREQQFDKQLVDRGLTTAKLLIQIDEVDVKLLKIIDRNNLTALSNEKITVYKMDGREIYSSDEDPRIPLTNGLLKNILKHHPYFFNYKNQEAVGLIYTFKNDRYVVMVSAMDTFGWKKIRHMRNLLIVSNIISIVVIYLAGWFFSNEALLPISKIVKEVNLISFSNLHSRVSEGNGKDEIAQLAITFNHMLQRIHLAFQAQKSFVSNASHELRTPLTSIKAQLQVALMNERKKIQYQHILESVLQDVDNLVNLSNSLLTLAQTERSALENTEIRIEELLLTCMGEMNKKYGQQVMQLQVGNMPSDISGFIIKGDEMLLKTAIVNVLDNACKFSSGKVVLIHLDFHKNHISLKISDQGEGIRQEDFPQIFFPFYRGSNVRNYPGSGIGLSLTKNILASHGGEIFIRSEVGRGTEVVMKFYKTPGDLS